MKQQRGATLIEVLITLLIIKIGLLGVLAGQLLALKWVTDATQRTTAIALSQEIVQQLHSFNSPHKASDFQLAEQPASECSAHLPCQYTEARQYLLSRWQAKWQGSAHSYGLLLDPQFCLQQHNGQLQLAVSWQQNAAFAQGIAPTCKVGNGRSGLSLAQE
ncbi:type IV pilus modification protein PilV [Alishewanella sp. 16-MA]|uniref:Type IV pilus modification protein PilV n=1 Tax=Alishewanella maricola TaxID=2795740 RepID=A0ABS8C434_9ALTE|nr:MULTISPECIES: type IV pilus modification protein PilV [Alishewanella]MDP4946607.1 type IV pilus modification protein PilV [Alishewanella sp.]MCB5227093.1 type IV pilus modification protein PilV [Alishewanella maricola]MDP5036381.1 type IV pilus modification protein PilV [Alishewanella sp.]MDP5187026.1 type IV pilus modification protein PilV [Alishewanella sp.]MDP5459423.1 type IV pilus modification protein PilV [Alishewanella sp. SMS8]